MAWIFEHSATWRRIIAVTRDSPVAMAAFTAACFGGAYGLGKLAMAGTDSREAALEAELRSRMTTDHKVLARAQKERLGVLLGEIERREGGDDRYAASLQGKSLGTHSSGTTVGARAHVSKP